jgi:cardiolipin synthase
MKRTPPPVAELLPARQYVERATACIDAAEKHVTLFTMIITQDGSTAKLIDALCAAAKRGVSVRVAADIFTLGVMSAETAGLPWRNRGIRSARHMRNRLKKSGVKFSWIGQLGPVIYAQRTHVKWLIVDQDVFCFGGVNLYKNGLQHIDYMLRMHDPQLGEDLETEHTRIHRADRTGNTYRSHSFPCLAGTVLVDGGLFGNSIIYRRACELTEKAAHVLLVSQYAPSGRLTRLLATKSSAVYYNRWQYAFGMNKWLLRFGVFFSKQATQYRGKRYIHAKFLIATMPDGSKTAISGSHNFNRGGVVLGTREVALETTDPSVIAQLETFHQTYIANAKA